MVPAGRLLAFTAVAFIIIVIPGPSVLFAIGRALAHGRRIALASVVGNETGSLVLAVLVAAGVGSLVERSALILTVTKLAGAAYLVFLGARAFLQRGRHALAEYAEAPRGGGRAALDGFLVGVANPKTIGDDHAELPRLAAVDQQVGEGLGPAAEATPVNLSAQGGGHLEWS